MATGRRLRWQQVQLAREGDEATRVEVETPLGTIRIRADVRNFIGRPMVAVDFQPEPGVVLDGMIHTRLVGLPEERPPAERDVLA